MYRVFIIFVLLQLADLGTTAAAVTLGGGEQNPLVRHLMTLGPIEGVVMAKLLAVGVGLGCLLASKLRALRLANVFFAGIVAWNLTIIFRLVA